MAVATVTPRANHNTARVRIALGVDAGDRIEFVEVGKGEFNIVAATRSVKETERPVSRQAKEAGFD